MLFLLFTMGKDNSLKDSLNNLLSFYRENRELIAMFTEMTKGSSALSADKKPPEEEQTATDGGAQKSRSEQTGNDKILEEFLKRHGV